MYRCKAKHEELGITKDLLVFAQGERNQARHERNVLQADYTQAVRDRNEAQNAVNRAHANNRTIEPSSTYIKQSTRDDMATTAIGLPIFEGKATDDIDTFVRLYMGYLDTINLNPYAAGGPPESWKRAMGILRSCMAGEAAEWFDREITGKNWELSGITSAGGANLAAFVALVIPEAAGGPNAGTYVNGSEAQIYSRDPVNALVTIRAAFIPTHDLMGGDEAWKRAGARLTDRAAPATADAGVAVNNNHPIVFPGIKPNQALYWLRTQFPTVLDEKKRIRFNSLYQENEPVDAFYRTVKRAGKLLRLTDDLIIDQFFRGLSADNIFEAERFHNLNPDDLVKHLRNLKRRRAEMRLGKTGTCRTDIKVQFKQLQARPDPQDPDWDDGYVDHDVGDDPDAPEWTLDDHQNAIDLIMGYKRGTSKILTKQLQKAKDRRDDLDLA
ncbi:hypothetical protein GLOIN_2v1790588 [Rhizophagus irregularis DAOM 181602=DAOM 197198]|nr:hypothetical protein GLOIN_2v1790588 [Rhizophagus irregularis DAOM 181602=DAOM 197198]